MGMAPYGRPIRVDDVFEMIEVGDDGGFRLNFGQFYRLHMMKILARLTALFVLCIAISATSHVSLAQSPAGQWAPPQRVPGTDVPNDFPPQLIADSHGTVHGFTSERLFDQIAIVYRTWTLDQGWTEPVDILLSPLAGIARFSGAHLDQNGVMHVAFFGGNELNAQMYYARALAANAGNAHAWSPPEVIAEQAGPRSDAVLTGDDQGNLYVIYSGKLDGTGIYSTYSTDSGDTWSEPATVFLTRSETLWPSSFQTTIDNQNVLHATWVVVDETGNGQAIYYARFDPDEKQWSQPIELATRAEGQYETDWPSIIAYNTELIIVYNDSFPTTRWMRRSFDGGTTWSEPVRPFDHTGEYGFASLVIDSNNTLHMILGNRIGNPATHGMWHTTWLGEQWAPLQPIVSGPKADDFDPSRPYSAVSLGNVILTVWRTDTSTDSGKGVWYSYMTTDAPGLTPQALPTATASPVPTVTPTLAPILPTPTPTPERSAFSTIDPGTTQRQSPTPFSSLLAGIAPALVLIAGVIVVRLLMGRRETGVL